jgi:hypothetical protein
MGACRLGQIVQHISLLLAQRDDSGQHSFDKATATFALRAETAASPQDGPAQSTFSIIVGGFNTLYSGKRPQCCFEREDVGAGAIDLGTATCPRAWRYRTFSQL